MKNIVFLLVALLLVTACATTQPAPTSTPLPPTEPPPPTDTSIPPTQTPEQVVVEFGEVTFDGNECTVSGPAEVPMGKYSFVLNNMSELPENPVWVLGLLDGKTIQDLRDKQGEPGVWYPKPSWAFYGTKYYSFDDEVWVHKFNWKGEYVIYLHEESLGLWFCAQITVH